MAQPYPTVPFLRESCERYQLSHLQDAFEEWMQRQQHQSPRDGTFSLSLPARLAAESASDFLQKRAELLNEATASAFFVSGAGHGAGERVASNSLSSLSRWDAFMMDDRRSGTVRGTVRQYWPLAAPSTSSSFSPPAQTMRDSVISKTGSNKIRGGCKGVDTFQTQSPVQRGLRGGDSKDEDAKVYHDGHNKNELSFTLSPLRVDEDGFILTEHDASSVSSSTSEWSRQHLIQRERASRRRKRGKNVMRNISGRGLGGRVRKDRTSGKGSSSSSWNGDNDGDEESSSDGCNGEKKRGWKKGQKINPRPSGKKDAAFTASGTVAGGRSSKQRYCNSTGINSKLTTAKKNNYRVSVATKTAEDEVVAVRRTEVTTSNTVPVLSHAGVADNGGEEGRKDKGNDDDSLRSSIVADFKGGKMRRIGISPRSDGKAVEASESSSDLRIHSTLALAGFLPDSDACRVDRQCGFEARETRSSRLSASSSLRELLSDEDESIESHIRDALKSPPAIARGLQNKDPSGVDERERAVDRMNPLPSIAEKDDDAVDSLISRKAVVSAVTPFSISDTGRSGQRLAPLTANDEITPLPKKALPSGEASSSHEGRSDFNHHLTTADSCMNSMTSMDNENDSFSGCSGSGSSMRSRWSIAQTATPSFRSAAHCSDMNADRLIFPQRHSKEDEVSGCLEKGKFEGKTRKTDAKSTLCSNKTCQNETRGGHKIESTLVLENKKKAGSSSSALPYRAATMSRYRWRQRQRQKRTGAEAEAHVTLKDSSVVENKIHEHCTSRKEVGQSTTPTTPKATSSHISLAEKTPTKSNLSSQYLGGEPRTEQKAPMKPSATEVPEVTTEMFRLSFDNTTYLHGGSSRMTRAAACTDASLRNLSWRPFPRSSPADDKEEDGDKIEDQNGRPTTESVDSKEETVRSPSPSEYCDADSSSYRIGQHPVLHAFSGSNSLFSVPEENESGLFSSRSLSLQAPTHGHKEMTMRSQIVDADQSVHGRFSSSSLLSPTLDPPPFPSSVGGGENGEEDYWNKYNQQVKNDSATVSSPVAAVSIEEISTRVEKESHSSSEGQANFRWSPASKHDRDLKSLFTNNEVSTVLNKEGRGGEKEKDPLEVHHAMPRLINSNSTSSNRGSGRDSAANNEKSRKCKISCDGRVLKHLRDYSSSGVHSGFGFARRNHPSSEMTSFLFSVPVIVIQTSLRRYLARVGALDRMSSILMIQSWYRRQYSERLFHQYQHAAVCIQSVYRGSIVRSHDNVRHFLACEIQRMVRGYLACRQVQDELEKLVTVQSIIRRRRERNKKIVAVAQGKDFGGGRNKRRNRKNGTSGRARSRNTAASSLSLSSSSSMTLARRKDTRVHRWRQTITAAIIIQTCWRQWACEATFKIQRGGCVQIQRTFRGWYVRSLLNMTFYFATEIQRMARGYLRSRKYQTCLRRSIIVIQSIVRMKKAREEAYLRFISVVSIQCHWRGYYVRRKYLDCLSDVKLVQSIIRRGFARDEACLRFFSIVVLQCLWRMSKARSEYSKLAHLRHREAEQEQNRKIILVQSLFRKNMAQGEACIRLYSVVLVQSAFRGFQTRSLEKRRSLRDSCAIPIQARWRAYSYQLCYRFVLYYIVSLQSSIRRYLARKTYLRKVTISKRILAKKREELRYIASTIIQARWRTYECRMIFFYALSNVLLIQSVARRWLATRYVISFVSTSKLRSKFRNKKHNHLCESSSQRRRVRMVNGTESILRNCSEKEQKKSRGGNRVRWKDEHAYEEGARKFSSSSRVHHSLLDLALDENGSNESNSDVNGGASHRPSKTKVWKDMIGCQKSRKHSH